MKNQMLIALLGLYVLCSVQATPSILGNRNGNGALYDSLRSTFGHFFSVPMTSSDASSSNWTSIATCATQPTLGDVRYTGGDIGHMAVYGTNGVVRATILGVDSVGPSMQKPPMKFYPATATSLGKSFWGVEAHYTDPAAACSTESASSKFNTKDGFYNNGVQYGDRLWIANGNTGTYVQAPLTENATVLNATGWFQGGCFWTMGRHYWRNLSANMSCDDTYPIFLLYNKGQLNAWGIAFSHSDRPTPPGSRWEHPEGQVLKAFFNNIFPVCLLNAGTLSTQHVYMQNPLTDFC